MKIKKTSYLLTATEEGYNDLTKQLKQVSFLYAKAEDKEQFVMPGGNVVLHLRGGEGITRVFWFDVLRTTFFEPNYVAGIVERYSRGDIRRRIHGKIPSSTETLSIDGLVN